MNFEAKMKGLKSSSTSLSRQFIARYFVKQDVPSSDKQASCVYNIVIVLRSLFTGKVVN